MDTNDIKKAFDNGLAFAKSKGPHYAGFAREISSKHSQRYGQGNNGTFGSHIIQKGNRMKERPGSLRKRVTPPDMTADGIGRRMERPVSGTF